MNKKKSVLGSGKWQRFRRNSIMHLSLIMCGIVAMQIIVLNIMWPTQMILLGVILLPLTFLIFYVWVGRRVHIRLVD